jgi:TusA-related sulfurtransferase
MNAEVAVMALDCGELPLGGGFLALLRPALNGLEPGGMLAVLSRSTSVREDLSSWCRAERHEYLGFETIAAGIDRHLIARRFLCSTANGQRGSTDGKRRKADCV